MTTNCVSLLVANRAPIKSDVSAAVGAEVLLAENKRAQRRIASTRERDEASLGQVTLQATAKRIAQVDDASGGIDLGSNRRFASLDKEVLRRHKDSITRWCALSVGATGDITGLVTGEIAIFNNNAEVGGLALVRCELEGDPVTATVVGVDIAPVAVESLVGTIFNLDVGRCGCRVGPLTTV